MFILLLLCVCLRRIFLSCVVQGCFQGHSALPKISERIFLCFFCAFRELFKWKTGKVKKKIDGMSSSVCEEFREQKLLEFSAWKLMCSCYKQEKEYPTRVDKKQLIIRLRLIFNTHRTNAKGVSLTKKNLRVSSNLDNKNRICDTIKIDFCWFSYGFSSFLRPNF